MAKAYFRNVPDFNYVSRLDGQKNISEYTLVKNLFKRAKIRDDIFNDLSFFTKYKIVGDDRPDNVAYELYRDARYDWVVLLANNVMNVATEWPKDQVSFYNYMIRKYGDESKFNEIHHYETVEIMDTLDRVVVRGGLEVPGDYVISYYDSGLDAQVTTTETTVSFTNYQYEISLEDEKRNIFVLKPEYLAVIKNDLDDIMPYKKGTSQFVNDSLVQGDNIRLYT
tara:strand:+ start:2016 stop:2687 length:672 start_codon:yes stop_codon:yes gene_type:complete